MKTGENEWIGLTLTKGQVPLVQKTIIVYGVHSDLKTQ